MSRFTTFFILVTVIFTVAPATPLRGQTIYATEFEEFEAGNDKLVGPGFWDFGSSIGTGSHGIDNELVSGLGNSAFLGFNEPSTTLVTVAVSHSYDPLAENKPLVEFESILGVEDSSNELRDTFAIIFLNSDGDLLASIEFRNTDNEFGLWYSNGKKINDSEIDFIRGELHLLTAQIDFAGNTWSAQLDGVDIFENVIFHDNGKTLNLGFTGAQWNLSSPQTANHGDNFLLIADWFLYATPAEKVQISSLTRDTTQDAINFSGEPGYIYHLEFSDDLVSWSPCPTPPTQREIAGDFFFGVERSGNRKFYRILRDFSPPFTK